MLRALARVNLAAIERNCARLAAAAAPAALCAVVKADGYGHGAVPAARAAQAGGAAWLAVATAAEAAELRAGGRRGPAARARGAVGRGARRRARAPAPTSRAGGRRRSRRSRAAPRELGVTAGVHVKLDTGHGPPRHARRRRGLAHRRRGGRRARAAARRRLHPLRDGRRGRPGLPARAARALHRLGAGRARVASRTCSCTRRTPPPRCRAGRAPGHGPLRRRDLRPRPVPARPGRAGPGARAGAALLPGRGQALRGGRERGLRAALRRRARHVAGHDPDRLRRRLPARAHQQRRGPRRRAPRAGGRRGLDGQHHGRPRPGRAPPAEPGATGGADRRRRCGPRSWPSGWGRSTTRSRAGISERVPRAYHRDGAPA